MTQAVDVQTTSDETQIEIVGDTEQTISTPQAIQFKDCKVSFAVDVSGSTLGPILQHEQEAVLDICSRLSDSSQKAARVLPWASTADNPVAITDLKKLGSYGGTEPTCLLENLVTRHRLQRSTIWFLFTDGEIDEFSVRDFARGLAKSGLHGTACVTVVFAPAEDKPDASNISVGVSVFAAAPDCLFLYFDTSTCKLYLLQCSGRFTQILEMHRKAQPILNEDTKWSDLPQIEFSDLEHISIPAPRILSADEIALPDGLVLNLKDLWAGKIKDDTIIDQILLKDDNLKSLTLTAQTRGETRAFHKWLEPFLDDTASPLRKLPGVEGQATRSIRAIIEEMQTGVSEDKKRQLQKDLQNFRDLEIQSQHIPTSARSSFARASASAFAISRSSERAFRPRHLSAVSMTGTESYQSLHPPVSADYPPTESAMFKFSVTGFQAPDSKTTIFKGHCTICGADRRNMVYLLRKQHLLPPTPGFPSPEASQWLFCPLALGNFPETDIISSGICCDDCSYALSESGETLQDEKLDCVLPMVTYTGNEEAYLQQLKSALDGRFADDIIPQVWLAILVNTYQRLPNTHDNSLLRSAIRWSCKDLVSNVQCHESLTGALGFEPAITAPKPLWMGIDRFFDKSYDPDGKVPFDYPLPGFAVMVLALEYAQLSPRLPQGINNLVWHRLLYQVTTAYHNVVTEKGHSLAQLKVMELVSEPTNKTPVEKSVRKISVQGLRGFGRSWLGDRILSAKRMTVSPEQLAVNDMLDPPDLVTLRMLGRAFQWSEDNTGSALCVFLHFLARRDNSDQTPWQWFQDMRSDPRLKPIFEKPAQIKAKHVADLTADLSVLTP